MAVRDMAVRESAVSDMVVKNMAVRDAAKKDAAAKATLTDVSATGDSTRGGGQAPGLDAGDLLTQAWSALAQAEAAAEAGRKFERASVAAVRAASAVLASCPHRVAGARPQSVWTLMVRCAPELREWADFFGATTRACVALRSHGIADGGVTMRAADDLARDADRFLRAVRGVILRRGTRRAARAAAE